MSFDPEHLILEVVRDTFSTRDEVALVYALALRTNFDTDWSKVNAAIIERWTPSALEYIKRKAWKRNDSFQDRDPASKPLDPRFPNHVEGCICPRFKDIAPSLIADLTCPVHGVNGTDPGDVLPDSYQDTKGAE